MAEEFSAAPSGGGKFSLKKKIGPLELWQWAAATLGVVFAYMAYKNHAANSSGGPAQAATNTSLPGTGAQPTDIGTTISGQLTDLTGQVGQLQQSVAALSPAGGTTPTGGVSTVQTTSSTSGGEVANLFGLLGRAPSASDTTYWNQYVASNGVYQSIAAIGSGPEAQSFAQANPAGFVTAEYKAANLTPDAAGVAYWQGYIQQNGVAQESKAFAASAKGAPL